MKTSVPIPLPPQFVELKTILKVIWSGEDPFECHHRLVYSRKAGKSVLLHEFDVPDGMGQPCWQPSPMTSNFVYFHAAAAKFGREGTPKVIWEEANERVVLGTDVISVERSGVDATFTMHWFRIYDETRVAEIMAQVLCPADL